MRPRRPEKCGGEAVWHWVYGNKHGISIGIEAMDFYHHGIWIWWVLITDGYLANLVFFKQRSFTWTGWNSRCLGILDDFGTLPATVWVSGFGNGKNRPIWWELDVNGFNPMGTCAEPLTETTNPWCSWCNRWVDVVIKVYEKKVYENCNWFKMPQSHKKSIFWLALFFSLSIVTSLTMR